MTTPFRDDLAAALERAGELEAENAELRERLSAFEKNSSTNATELDTALKTTHGLASRLQRENEELRAELEKVSAARDALAHAHQELQKIQRRKPPKWASGPFGKVLAVLYLIVGLIGAAAWMVDKLGHC